MYKKGIVCMLILLTVNVFALGKPGVQWVGKRVIIQYLYHRSFPGVKRRYTYSVQVIGFEDGLKGRGAGRRCLYVKDSIPGFGKRLPLAAFSRFISIFGARVKILKYW